MAIETSVSRLLEQARLRPAEAAYHVKRDGRWHTTSWGTYAEQVRQGARALLSLGLEKGETVCILGFNRPEWTQFDLAATYLGGVPAGIYVTSSAEEVAYIVDHAESRFVLVENTLQWQKIAAVRDRLPRLKRVILMAGADVPEDPLALAWADFLALGDGGATEAIEARRQGLQPQDLATLIYTSGTTGPPKAVMLTHHNVAWTAKIGVAGLFSIGAEDSVLSYLPLSHIAEMMFSIHAAVTAGYSVYFAEGPDQVAENLREVQPTVVFGVPRVWERLYGAVRAKIEALKGPKRHLLAWAMGIGREITARRCAGEAPGGWLALRYRLARRLVFSRMKPLLGLGRARVCVSGAAPIAREILEYLAGLDLLVYEVYGQSEGSGPTSFNRPGKTRLGTVGPALPEVEVRIADDGEILVRGPNVFLGYFKDPAATAETLVDGWLYSGDLGSFDKDGFLSVTGRKKEILITSGGKNIAPGNIEVALKELELVTDAVVLGDRRRYLAALLTLDPSALARFAAAQGISGEEAYGHPALEAELEKAVAVVNGRFSRVEHVRRFRVLPGNFSIEGGELTPTLKLKRRIIEEKYAQEIAELYREET